MAEIRILLADDHAMFREGLRQVLGADPRMMVVAEAASGSELLALAKAHQPDVVLLDVSMPGRGGLEALEDLKRWNRGVKVLMLTAHPEDRFAVRCLKMGADGYMTKEEAGEALLEAIIRISAGGKYISSELAEKLALELSGEMVSRPHDALSGRELQVLHMLGSGKGITQIGDELCLSVKTISTYRSRILQKLHLETTAELIRYALEEGLTL